MKLHRWALVLSLFLVSPLQIYAIEVAITIDDPGVEEAPGYRASEINKRILATLKKKKIQAALFVCGHRVDHPTGRALLKAWDDSNHWITNHSYSHLNLHSPQVTLAQYENDISKNTPLLSGYKNFQPYFRFPFLKEGNTKEKRDGIREYLRKNKLRNGYVTIDTSDWAISRSLKSALVSNRKDLKPYRDYYIRHMLDRMRYYDKLSNQALGRSVKHTLLIHHNVLNALFLGDLLDALQKEGVKLISVRDAYSDPVYEQTPEHLPAGESLLWMIAKLKNPEIVDERYPAEDGSYIEEEMKKAGL